jgi:DNA-binding NarL/FixJ family response regulator
MAIRVIVADDHKLFRQGLINLINGFKDIEVIGDVADGRELLEMLNHRKPDVILLDIQMPVMDGMQALKQMPKTNAPPFVVVLSMMDGNRDIFDAIEAGAVGYLHKNAEPEEIELALNSVVKSGFYFNERTNKALLQRMIAKDSLNPTFEATPKDLSDIEREVLVLLCKELTSQEIAEKVSLSKRGVDSVRERLFDKTGCKNIAGLALFAAKHKLVDL